MEGDQRERTRRSHGQRSIIWKNTGTVHGRETKVGRGWAAKSDVIFFFKYLSTYLPMYLFIWLFWVLVAAHGSLIFIVAQRVYSLPHAASLVVACEYLVVAYGV